jgi:hypothetical protein
MPVHWTIDSRDELIAITAGGDVGYSDVTECLDAMVDAKALGYRKLVDCAAASFVMSMAELVALSVKVRGLHGTGAMGAAAFVLNIEPSAPEVQLLGALAAADRPLRLFKAKAQAKRWIDGLVPERSAR